MKKVTLKSQRAYNDQVSIECKVPWPQNHVSAGSSKTRVTYDSLSTFQWIAGCCTIIREETDIQVKNAMLEYITDIVGGCPGFRLGIRQRGTCLDTLLHEAEKIELAHIRQTR